MDEAEILRITEGMVKLPRGGYVYSYLSARQGLISVTYKTKMTNGGHIGEKYHPTANANQIFRHPTGNIIEIHTYPEQCVYVVGTKNRCVFGGET